MRDDLSALDGGAFGRPASRHHASHVSARVESTAPPPLGPLARAVLRDLGLPAWQVSEAEALAARNGTDTGCELVAGQRVREEDLSAAMARALNLAVETIPPDEAVIELPSRPTPRNVVRTCSARAEIKLYIAPKLEELAIVERTLARSATARSRMRIATPRELRRCRAAETVAERLKQASLSLSAERLDQSARQTVTGAQGAALASLLVALLLLAYSDPAGLILFLHVASGLVFFAPTSLRLAAALAPSATPSPPVPDSGAIRPVYSVLVAMRQEDEVVGHLVRSLAALNWPRSRLEVLLVCEADDPDTISAARSAIVDEPGFEVVVVPVSHPRTKPKALNFALPLATGDFVVLFDAEDRPHPDQLELAWRTFCASDDRLACLQAELTIGNGRQSWISRLFAAEYFTLFRGVLPWLSAHGLPMPLGGTSNHFRRAHLAAVGAWDSHNVTEDADLGIRLCRHGFRVATLRSETIEDAPTEYRIWHRQRTRWMKGWLQTYLVHMRDPGALLRDLGWKSFAVFQVLFIGMIASAAAHPLFLALLGSALALLLNGDRGDLWFDILFGIDLLNALGGVMAVVLLARVTVRGPDRRLLLRGLVWLYVYWALVSLSTARAFYELARRPHHWAKTPHGLPFDPAEARREAAADADLSPESSPPSARRKSRFGFSRFLRPF